MESIRDEHSYADPEASAERKDERRRLIEAMEQLPFQERQVIVMRFFNNMKLNEIASACEISRSTVKRYLAQGQKKLGSILNG
jgi:RNA polymerase sigma-70 factor (ECF subfamily)